MVFYIPTCIRRQLINYTVPRKCNVLLRFWCEKGISPINDINTVSILPILFTRIDLRAFLSTYICWLHPLIELGRKERSYVYLGTVLDIHIILYLRDGKGVHSRTGRSPLARKCRLGGKGNKPVGTLGGNGDPDRHMSI